MYINDICRVSQALQLELFVDGTNIFCYRKDFKELLGEVKEVSELKMVCEKHIITKFKQNKIMILRNYRINIQVELNREGSWKLIPWGYNRWENQLEATHQSYPDQTEKKHFMIK